MSIIIRNDSTGQSKGFSSTKEGYAQADAYIKQITQSGHRVGGPDLGKVGSYFGNISGGGGVSDNTAYHL